MKLTKEHLKYILEQSTGQRFVIKMTGLESSYIEVDIGTLPFLLGKTNIEAIYDKKTNTRLF